MKYWKKSQGRGYNIKYVRCLKFRVYRSTWQSTKFANRKIKQYKSQNFKLTEIKPRKEFKRHGVHPQKGQNIYKENSKQRKEEKNILEIKE